MHLQPEATTSFQSGIYVDQVLAIERLAKLLPPDWYIYVKENPSQNEYMRGELFFKRLHLLPQIKYIDKKVPSAMLLQHCQFCATINGTASFESLCGGKATLIFGRIWWDFLPGVFRYHKDLDIQQILNYKIDSKALAQQYNEYLGRTIYASVQPASIYRECCPTFTDQINQDNLVRLLTDLVKELNTTENSLGCKEKQTLSS